MAKQLLLAAYGIEFLIALMATLDFWSQVGGQSHLDLMPWHFKFALAIAVSATVVRITIVCGKPGGPWTPAMLRTLFLLAFLLFAGGLITYYYHLHEPPADEESDEPNLTRTFHCSKCSAASPESAPVSLRRRTPLTT